MVYEVLSIVPTVVTIEVQKWLVQKRVFQNWQKKSTKRILSSGISSKTTNRIADNHGANVRDKALLRGNMQDIGMQAGSSALFAAALSVAGETVGSYRDYRHGHISGGEYAGRILKTTGTSAAKISTENLFGTCIERGYKTAGKSCGEKYLQTCSGFQWFHSCSIWYC